MLVFSLAGALLSVSQDATWAESLLHYRLPGSWEVNFARHSVIFDKKCVIFDKSEKVIYLLKNFNFETLKVMKTCLVIRFLAVICPGIRFFWEILPGLGFALATHPYLLLLGSCSPPPHSASCYMNVGQKYMYCIYKHNMLQ